MEAQEGAASGSHAQPNAQASVARGGTPAPPSGDGAPSVAPEGAPWAGAGAGVLAILLAAFSEGWAGFAAALGCIVVAAVASLLTGAREDTRADPLVWGAAPAGAVLAGLAALMARWADPVSFWPLVGAGLAALLVVLRAWLDRRTRAPIQVALAGLTRAIPRRVRAPARVTGTLEVLEEEMPTDRIRAGEEVLTQAGEVVAVDGVVKAGEAEVLLYPSARTPVHRGIGDPLLAGARIVDGALRLMATRVGDDRALFRPRRFGHGSGPGTARVARRAEQAARWGSALAVVVAVAGAGVLNPDGGLEGALSAAAAVLLGAPLLAARRAAEAPLMAAGAAAADRGIVFHDARALESAGRITACALCTHSTVTEGAPEIVEVHPIGDADLTEVLALAAAAQSAADGTALSDAIRRHAERHGIAPESVRRATYLPGRGVTALGPGGEPLVIGNRHLLLEEGVSVAVADEHAQRAEVQGLTTLFLALAGRVRAVLVLQDPIQPGARAAVQRIVDLGIEPVLLSGNHRATVEALARALDVTHLKAELLPEERATEVRRLSEAGGLVAVVGHSRADDDALGAADVPIVMAAAGGPSGDRGMALSTSDLRDVAGALWLARAARVEAWRGVALSVIAGTVVVAGAAAGLLAPAFAALLGVMVDLVTLPSGGRLLRRIEVRLPTRG